MIWFLFAFLTAIFESIKDVFSKKGLSVINEYIIAWSLWFFALPILIPILCFIGFQPVNNVFWHSLFVGGVLNVIATVLYMKAIKYSDLSITVPLVAFTPLFLLITSPLIVGEFPSLFGLIGVILIVIGSYFLKFNRRHNGYLEPFKSLINEKGPRFMLIVAFIWSISSNVDKIGVLNSNPVQWITAMSVFVSLMLTPFMLFGMKKDMGKFFVDLRVLLPIGFVYSFTILCQMTAISLTLVAYTISIKRTRAIFTVLWGYLIFKERDIKNRLLGSMIMVLGVLFITFS
jgi:drug/metabolite transporter (DMT)-like permease